MTAQARWAILIVTVLFSAGALTAEGHDGPTANPLSWSTQIYVPTPIPDRICSSWTGDPATSFSVTWRTDETIKLAVAQIAIAADGPDFETQATQVNGATQRLETDLGPAHYHQVDFRDLQPSTKYLYRVGDGETWSEWIQFRTASSEAEPFAFVYFGDAQNSIKSHWSRVVRQAFQDASRAAFFLHAGDLVNSATSDAEWGEWYYANGFIPQSIPVVATPGNHEMVSFKEGEGEQETTIRKVTPHWYATFALPENGPPGLAETCYYVDYQGTRIVSLNSNQRHQEQASWLEEVLSEPGPRWRILAFHHPIYSSATGRDNQQLRELWQPLFDKYKVDLVLQGHDHTYARSRPMKFQPGPLAEINVATGQNHQDLGGTVYVVSVSGPKMYELEPQPFMARWATKTQLYQVIRVDDDVLTYRAMTATGDCYDEFQLRKQADGPNQLVPMGDGKPE